nr:MAG TPA: PcfJ like protein [Caudoviricetes sp.]
MNILTMRKNKGTIEVKTDRRLYVIDFLNDKILSNGKEIKALPSDVLRFYFKCCHSRAYDKETVLLALLVHFANDNFKSYREAESFVSIAIQNLDLEYRVDLADMCNFKLTKDYLEWCREHEEPVCLRTIDEHRQEKLEDSIPKELKPYYVMMKIHTATENIDRETLFKLLKIIKYTVCHLRADEAVNDIENLYDLTYNLTNKDKKLLNTNRTVSQNYRIIEQQKFVNNDAFENTLKRLNFMNGKCFDNYIVVVPQNVMDLINEGFQQNNCVGYYYNNSIKNGNNCIFFLRKKNKPEKSYITCRYSIDDKEVVEARYKNNCDIDSVDEKIIYYYINNFINDNI